MTGIPDFNYPAFNAEADRLRNLGYHVENPAENPECSDWAGYMKAAIAQMITCDAVALLPGWSYSKGASLEHALAIALDMQVSDAERYGSEGYCRDNPVITIILPT